MNDPSVLDPAGREDRRLLQTYAVIQCDSKKVLRLQGVALRRIDQRCLVQDFLPVLGVNEEAHVELANIGVAAKAKAESRIGVAEDGQIVTTRGCRRSRKARHT